MTINPDFPLPVHAHAQAAVPDTPPASRMSMPPATVRGFLAQLDPNTSNALRDALCDGLAAAVHALLASDPLRREPVPLAQLTDYLTRAVAGLQAAQAIMQVAGNQRRVGH